MSLDGLSNLPFRQRKKNEVLRLHFVLVAGEGFAVALHCHSTDGQTKTGATCRFVGLHPKVALNPKVSGLYGSQHSEGRGLYVFADENIYVLGRTFKPSLPSAQKK